MEWEVFFDRSMRFELSSGGVAAVYQPERGSRVAWNVGLDGKCIYMMLLASKGSSGVEVGANVLLSGRFPTPMNVQHICYSTEYGNICY